MPREGPGGTKKGIWLTRNCGAGPRTKKKKKKKKKKMPRLAQLRPPKARGSAGGRVFA